MSFWVEYAETVSRLEKTLPGYQNLTGLCLNLVGPRSFAVPKLCTWLLRRISCGPLTFWCPERRTLCRGIICDDGFRGGLFVLIFHRFRGGVQEFWGCCCSQKKVCFWGMNIPQPCSFLWDSMLLLPKASLNPKT